MKKEHTTEEALAMERQRDIVASLFKAKPDDPISDRLDIASDALFMTCRNGDLPEHEMVMALALVSGFACGIMIEAKKKLEEVGQ